MNITFLNKRCFIYHIRKTKGVNFMLAKKIHGYFGFSLFKYKHFYYLQNNKFFISIFFIIINFIKKKFILLQHKKVALFENYKVIGHYKGKRLIFLLPLNSQRTHTNAKTIRKLLKGKVVVIKKKDVQKKNIKK
jgi:hypothetical protein